MNNIKTNNKTKTATTLIFVLMIGLILLSPTAILPNAHAQRQSRNLPADWQLEQHTILNQLRSHRGTWVSMTECEQDNCHLTYLGPIKSNPHGHGIPQLVHSYKLSNGQDPYQAVSAQIQPTSYSDGVNTQDTNPAEIEQDFKAESSSNSNTDLFQNLNSWDGPDAHWVQSVLFYDSADLTGQGVGWYAEMDSHDSSGNEDFSSIPISAVTTNSNTDNFSEYLFALGNSTPADDGCYEAEVDDTSSGNGYTFSICESSDTGTDFLLTSQLANGMPGDSGSMTEEQDTDDTSTYYWSTSQSDITYTLGFYDSLAGTEYTTVNGWTSYYNGNSGDITSLHCTGNLSISESSNQDTMKYTYSSGC